MLLSLYARMHRQWTWPWLVRDCVDDAVADVKDTLAKGPNTLSAAVKITVGKHDSAQTHDR